MPKGKFGDQGATDQCQYLPTAEQIEAAKAELRANWDRRRWQAAERELAAVPARTRCYAISDKGLLPRGHA